MKYFLILVIISFNINADPYRVMNFLDNTKGITTLNIDVPEGWKISKSDGEYGDYLVTEIKSVYFLGTLSQETNDKNMPISLADFEQIRHNNNAHKETINGVDIYYVTRKNDKNVIENYTFSRFIKTGYAIHASIYPYPEYKGKPLDQEVMAVQEMLSKIVFPDDLKNTDTKHKTAE